ncbi:hypothetical protein U9M48_005982 [Paspalum notatum var. saurae]|uniref:RING-type E3 ubiquitin transferase n=1 Tax=Paspalum notatum var. saurae TaxID=547442 RepID=A0AAQ3SKD9_PASNO
MARRLLQTNSGQYPTLPAAEPPSPLAVDSDVVVILAALLCAIICVVGLASVARCARARRGGTAPSSSAAAAAAKGLRKKALRALPTLAYEDAVAAAAGGEEKPALAECAICLSEFAPREEIRLLPHCGHGFHVACVDTWLAAHSSCPSCRRVLVVDDAAKRTPEAKRCRKCEAAMEEASSSSSASVVADRAADVEGYCDPTNLRRQESHNGDNGECKGPLSAGRPTEDHSIDEVGWQSEHLESWTKAPRTCYE